MATQTEASPVRAPGAARSRTAALAARRLDIAVVGAPAAVAIALCLYELTSRSLWLDEAATVAIAGQHGSALWSAIAHDGGNMLGYYALLHVLIGWFGDGAFVIRLPSVIAAGAAAGAAALLGLRLLDRRAALAGGLLTAVSLPLVFWGQDARGYAAMVALVTGSFVAFAALVDGPPGRDSSPPGSPRPGSSGRGSLRPGSWIAYVVLTTLSVYASFVAIFAVPAQLVVLAWRPRSWRRVAAALAACAVCWIPLAVLALNRGSNQLFWITRPSLTAEKQVILALTSAGFEPNFRPSAVATVLAIVTVLLVLAAVVRIVLTRDRAPLLVVSWLLVPFAVMWLESLIGQPIFTARNLLVSLPAAGLLVGWVITRIRLAWALPALAVLLALRVIALAPAYGTSPENWRTATAYVLASSRPGDCVAFYPLDASMPFDYYARRPVEPHVEQYDVPRIPSGCSRVWLVVSHEGQPNGTASARAHYARYASVRSSLAREFAHRTVRSFGYASVVWIELFER